jgi:hypothetical protein
LRIFTAVTGAHGSFARRVALKCLEAIPVTLLAFFWPHIFGWKPIGDGPVVSLSKASEILTKTMAARPRIIRPANISKKRLMGVETTGQLSLTTDAIDAIFNRRLEDKGPQRLA